MTENNKDVILCTVPWQLLSCHYMIMKSFPCLTWKHIIMIKNNSEMSINAMPLLPHFLSLRYAHAPVSFFWTFSTAILMQSWWGTRYFMQSLKSVFLNLYFWNVENREVIYQSVETGVTFVKANKMETWCMSDLMTDSITDHNIQRALSFSNMHLEVKWATSDGEIINEWIT